MADIVLRQEMLELTDEQIEQLLLNKYYNDLNYFTLIDEYCNSRFFQNKSFQKLFGIMKKYYQKYNKMPTTSILEMIFQKLEKVETGEGSKLKREFETALNLKISHDEDFIKDNILQFIKHKSAYFSFMDHIEGVTIKGDVSDCLTDFQKILTIGFNDDLGFDYFTDHEDHRQEMLNPEDKIATNYKQLDRVTFGGLPTAGKSLFMIIAQPGLGKSLLMSNMAVNFMQNGLFPVIISLEMCERMYGNRIDAHISSLNINDLRNNIDSLKNKVEGFQSLHSDAKLLIKEYPPSTVSCLTIQNYIDKIITMGRTPDVIFVDYVNLLKPNGGGSGQGMYEKVGDICRELRALSYRYNCPVVSASQVNRSGVNTSDVGMDNVSESMGIAHTSDFIGALWQQEGDMEACRLNMKILKNRLGGLVGKNLQFHMNYNTLRLTDAIDLESESTSSQDELMNELENL